MDLLKKLTIKNLKLNKKRTIVTIIGIMLSVALITAVASMYNSCITSLVKYETYEKGDFHVVFYNVPIEETKTLKNNRKISEVFLTQDVGYANLENSKNEYKPYAFIKAFTKASLENLSVKLSEGRLPENEDEIVIPTHLKPNEIADIEQAVREVYREKEITKDRDSIYEKEGGKYEGVITFGNIKKKMPTLTDFHRVMKEKIRNKGLTSTISNFLNGNTLGIFDCQSTLKINDQIICFDISEIKDEIMRYYVCLVLTTWITNKYMATKERNKRYVVVDEAWNLFKNKETSDFLENLARRARKKKVAMILATQNLSEMRQSNQAEAIINCCDTIILLKQSIGSIDEIMKFFKLPSGVKEILTKARPGECILIRGGDVRAIKIDMTKFESEFITT